MMTQSSMLASRPQEYPPPNNKEVILLSPELLRTSNQMADYLGKQVYLRPCAKLIQS